MTSPLPVETLVPHLVHARSARPRPPAPVSGTASDAELVTLAQRDPHAFALLYTRYLDPIHQYCYRRLGSREAAEDATSLVFAKALSALPRYHDTSFRSWLFTIAHHVIVDRYRDIRPEQALETATAVLDDAPSLEELAIAAEERRSVRALLAELPEHQRRVVELRLAGLTEAEIAQVLGRSRAKVDVTQCRAVARLRDLLRRESRRAEVTYDQ
jgi:RNA polymerase sigma-70 factor, ECF subfamily